MIQQWFKTGPLSGKPRRTQRFCFISQCSVPFSNSENPVSFNFLLCWYLILLDTKFVPGKGSIINSYQLRYTFHFKSISGVVYSSGFKNIWKPGISIPFISCATKSSDDWKDSLNFLKPTQYKVVTIQRMP